jgi:L-ascorbate metabolism protein UlaG (beta-lactamase superfamily)
MPTTLTWLGHSAFRVDTPSGKRLYVDPFLNGNPKCPEDEKEPERVDAIFITHGHNDHVGDALALAQKFQCPLVAHVELRDYLQMQGYEPSGAHDPNKGGTVDLGGIRVTLVHAQHSSSFMAEKDGGYEIVYTGEPCGLVFDFGPDGDGTAPKLYFAGDTNVFGDMRLIRELYKPDLAILPIGGHYTMGPREAALAVELLGVGDVMPIHYGTYPILAGTPEELRSELAERGLGSVRIHAPQPGGSFSR